MKGKQGKKKEQEQEKKLTYGCEGQGSAGQSEGRPCGGPPHAIELCTKTQHSPPRKASSPNEEQKKTNDDQKRKISKEKKEKRN